MHDTTQCHNVTMCYIPSQWRTCHSLRGPWHRQQPSWTTAVSFESSSPSTQKPPMHHLYINGKGWKLRRRWCGWQTTVVVCTYYCQLKFQKRDATITTRIKKYQNAIQYVPKTVNCTFLSPIWKQMTPPAACTRSVRVSNGGSSLSTTHTLIPRNTSARGVLSLIIVPRSVSKQTLHITGET